MKKEKHYPAKEELNEFWWFRLGKVLKWTFLVVAFLAPQILNGGWFDGVINALIWFIFCMIIKEVILYILYGKKPEGLRKFNLAFHEIILLIIIVGGVTLIIYSIYKDYKKEMPGDISQIAGMAFHSNKPEYFDTIDWWFSDGVNKDWANSQWECFNNCDMVLEKKNNVKEVWHISLTDNACRDWTNLPNEAKELLMSRENFCAQIQCTNGISSKKFCWNNPEKK